MPSYVMTHRKGGLSLRFFSPPDLKRTWRPEFPWHSLDDLAVALGLDPETAERLRRGLRREWGTDVRSAASPDGIGTCGPHWMAEGLIAAIEERDGEAAVIPARSLYRSGCTAALKEMTACLPAGSRITFALEAMFSDS